MTPGGSQSWMQWPFLLYVENRLTKHVVINLRPMWKVSLLWQGGESHGSKVYTWQQPLNWAMKYGPAWNSHGCWYQGA